MAHLWILSEQGEWAVLPLEASRLPLSGDLCRGQDEASAPAVLVRATDDDRTEWVLLVTDPHRIRVNGRPVATGIRVLRDRDEIRAGTERFFYSVEERVQVSEFAGCGKQVDCPRCKQPINKGELAVRCPHCGVLHHEMEELNCWTYTPECAVCKHTTALDADYQFVPEAL